MFFIEARYINKFFWLWILLVIGVAFVFPQLGSAVKPFLVYLLMGIMFLSSLKIKFSKILKDFIVFEKVEGIFIHLILIHILTPLLVIGFKRWLSPDAYVGFILAAVTSSAVAIVFLCNLLGGKPRRALEITTISNLLNMAAVPGLLLLFAGKYIAVDFLSVFFVVVKLILIPLVIAEIIHLVKLSDPIEKIASPTSIILILIITYGIIAPTRNYILQNLLVSLKLFLISLVIITAMFIIGYLTGKNKEEKITYGLASSFKNVTLATVIGLTVFGVEVALVPIVYTVASNLLLAPVYLIFAKK
jgi:BASS family bile acid:Na+ symporter